MFKCIDCEKIYSSKPDYCDCGNNLFEEIIEKDTSLKPKKTFFQQYPQIKKFIDTLDLLSLTIFLICIVLSVLVLVFENPQVQTSQVNHEKLELTKELPNIDSLWVSTVEKQEIKDVVKKQEKVKKTIENQVKKNQLQKTIKKVEQHKEIKKQQPQLKKEEVITPANSELTEVRGAAKEDIKIETAKNNEQLNNYKVALRQALFNNLAITSIVGSGECVITFAIQKDGKLIQRSFVQQSSNETVNKAVYNMMMKLPYYYAPPDGYNGEKIKIKFFFDNGVYEISYLD